MLHCGYQTMLSWIWISFHLKWVELFVPVFHHCITTIWDSFSFSTVKKFLIAILRSEMQPDNQTGQITVLTLNFRWIRFYPCSFLVSFRLSLQRFACAVTKNNKLNATLYKTEKSAFTGCAATAWRAMYARPLMYSPILICLQKRLWCLQALDQITLNKEAMVSNNLELAYYFKRKKTQFH